MASECHLGRLHLNSDWLVLEPVDEHHRPVPPGAIGHTTLLTNLANRVQPLIRYDLGDRVRLLPTACACGSSRPLIEVEGRVDARKLLTLGLLRHAGSHFTLPKGFYPLESIFLIIAYLALGRVTASSWKSGKATGYQISQQITATARDWTSRARSPTR